MRRMKLTGVLVAIILSLVACAQAQTPAPPAVTTAPIPPTATALPTPAATLTPPPAMLVIEATPIPQPQGDLLSEFWKQYKYAVIMAIVATLLIGVLLKRIIEKLADWGGKGLDWLGRRFANWAYFCRRNWQRYVATLNAETEAWQSMHGTELRMEDIYVAVQLTDLPAMYTRADAATNGAPTRKPRRRERRLEPRQAVADLRRVAVIGEPGAGKTTLLRWLAWLYANERAEAPSPPAWLSRPFPRRGRLETQAADGAALPRWLNWLTPIGRVPVLIPLKELQDVQDFAAYLPTYFKDHDWPDAHDFIGETLDKGKFLFLFDALDEVDDPAKLPPLVDMVNDFAARYSNEEHPNWIVLSSRPQSYQTCAMQLPTFKTAEVLEFEPQQIRDFLANWFRAEPSLAEQLWSQLATDDRLMELAANPLLLTFITEAYEQTLSLETRRRAGLFGEIVTVRMEEWDRKRGVRRDFQFMRPQKEGYLRGTALRLNAQTRSLIPRTELLEGVRAHLLADGRVDPDAPDPPHNRTQADRFLWEIAEGSGLLHEKAIAHYDFSHKTLREYFAAAELRELTDGGTRLLRHLGTGSLDRWGMVAVLYAGLCHDASSFIRALSERNPALTADGLLLAAYCLRDAASVAADPALRDDLSMAVVAALPAADPALQDEAIPVLRALHQARPDQLEAHARRLADSGHPTLAVRLLPDGPRRRSASQVKGRTA